jgi:4-hydroxy-2-oxoheptanedioate aldolase
MAQIGVDFILVDTQHGSFNSDSVLPLTFMAIVAGGAVPMARVARNDYTLIGRLLDEGALGIVVPIVQTRGDAKAAADACVSLSETWDAFLVMGSRGYLRSRLSNCYQ